MWLVLVVLLYLAGRRYDDPTRLRDILRLLPDVVRLLHRLSNDQALPRGVRYLIVALLAYLALPIDLVPDFIPVIGYADDVVLVVLTLRSVTRVAGTGALDNTGLARPRDFERSSSLPGSRYSGPSSAPAHAAMIEQSCRWADALIFGQFYRRSAVWTRA